MTASKLSPFWQGARDGAPFVLIMAPFGALFGLLASEAGLPLDQVLVFSSLVIAGAAQFTTLTLMEDGVPLAIAVISGLAVNLRMMMYSAALTPHFGPAPIWQRTLIAYLLVDQTYALSATRFEEVSWSTRQKVAYFTGTALYVFPAWVGSTLLGALAGERLPEWLALDFALPLAFIALVAPMLRSVAHVAAALVSVIGTLAFAWVPSNLGLLIAAALAMMVGAEIERRRT